NSFLRLVSFTSFATLSPPAGDAGTAGAAISSGASSRDSGRDSSRRQSSGRVSLRRRRKVGCRIPPSLVQSLKRTSQTSRGSTQWCPRPVGIAPPSEGGGGRGELFPQALEPLVVEAGADLGDVDEARAVVESDVQRAEVAARTLGIGVAPHHELSAALTLDLDP